MLGNAQQIAQQRDPLQPLIMNIRVGKGSLLSVSNAPSPMPGHGGKDMAKVKLAVEKEEGEERRAKAARDKKATKIGKQKAVTPSSSSCSFTTSSSEEEDP